MSKSKTDNQINIVDKIIQDETPNEIKPEKIKSKKIKPDKIIQDEISDVKKPEKIKPEKIKSKKIKPDKIIQDEISDVIKPEKIKQKKIKPDKIIQNEISDVIKPEKIPNKISNEISNEISDEIISYEELDEIISYEELDEIISYEEPDEIISYKEPDEIILDEIKPEKIKQKKIKPEKIKSNEIVDLNFLKVPNRLIDVDKMEINNLPDGVKVATMCSSCFLDSKLQLDDIDKYMVLHEDDILTVKRTKDNIKTLIKLKKPTKKALNPKRKDTSNNFYNSITLIVRVTTGPTEDINLEPRINVKLFKNGSLQMSGCKNIENVNVVLGKILKRLKAIKGKIEDGIIKEITFAEEPTKVSINNFKIDMIYCNYRISIEIDREKLYDLLKKKKVKCIYEPCIRACVIIKFVPTQDNPDYKEVSIFIFKKGNIIITGARSRTQVIEAYKYINNIFITHSDEIEKKSDETEEELIMNLYDDVLKDVENGLIEI